MSHEDYIRRQNSKEAWLKRQKLYWKNPSYPRFITRPGEIYEVDFGINVGAEFSGRHLAVCLQDTTPSQERVLVVPITTKMESYNISPNDIIVTTSNNGRQIKGGVVLGEAKYISKQRIFRVSLILEESKNTRCPVKGTIAITKTDIKRWACLL